MSWDPKYSTYGVVQIEGKNVRIYSDPDDYITIGLGEEIISAVWVDGELNLTLSSGKVRRYRDRNYFITL